jgi:low temperature requirement protein LtrA
VSELNAADESEDAKVERHASWAELFFDLVAAAGVAALARVLRFELDAAALGLYALLFLAFWLSWTTFMVYSNVAASHTHVIRLMVGMLGLGVMAASVPGVARAVLGDGGSTRPLTVFAIAYIATRVYGSQSWRRGDVLLDFPVVQYSAGLLPWLVSIWVGEPWKLALWGVGVGLDLLLILVLSGDKMLARMQAKFSAQGVIRRRRRPGVRSGRDQPVIHGVSVDPAHLSERLGLFVIIVLGESVVQVVSAAAAAQFSVGLLATGIASFVLLAGMFGLSVVFGYAGLPHLRAGRVPTRVALGLHCLITGVIATVAVSLSSVVRHGSDPLPGQGRWLLCGAVAAYFALGVVTGVASHSSDLQRTISRVTTGIAVPLLLGAFATGISGRTLVIYLALVVLAHLWFERRLAPDRKASTAEPATVPVPARTRPDTGPEATGPTNAALSGRAERTRSRRPARPSANVSALARKRLRRRVTGSG